LAVPLAFQGKSPGWSLLKASSRKHAVWHGSLQTLKSSRKSPSAFTPYSLCFHPHPLFQRYLQSNEILLHLRMKCWNSAFKCTTFESNYSSPTGRSSENISAVEEAIRSKERGDETQFTTKIGGKLVWVPVISVS
jgi:hypothetical protein